eukprot:1192943-Prorocentrum_minimum.AAC.1
MPPILRTCAPAVSGTVGRHSNLPGDLGVLRFSTWSVGTGTAARSPHVRTPSCSFTCFRRGCLHLESTGGNSRRSQAAVREYWWR